MGSNSRGVNALQYALVNPSGPGLFPLGKDFIIDYISVAVIGIPWQNVGRPLEVGGWLWIDSLEYQSTWLPERQGISLFPNYIALLNNQGTPRQF